MTLTISERNVILVYTTLAMVYLMISVLTVIYATTKVVKFQIAQVLKNLKSAQPTLIQCLHLGIFLVYIYAYITALHSLSTVVCITKLFLVHQGFFLIFGSLLLKLYRIFCILNSGFKKVVLTDYHMMRLMFVIMIFVWIYLIIITVIGGLKTNIIDYCHYEYYQIEYSLVAIEGIVLVAILGLSFAVRKAPSSLTDSSNIVRSINSCIILILSMFPLVILAPSTVREFIVCLGVVVASTFAVIETTGNSIYQIVMLSLEADRQFIKKSSFPHKGTDNMDDIAFLFDGSATSTAIGRIRKVRDLDFFQQETLVEISHQVREPHHVTSLAQIVFQETHQKEMVILFDALQRAFKIISKHVREAGTKSSVNKNISELKSASGRRIRSLDVLANQALARGLLNSKTCCALVSSESENPFIVPNSHAGNYVVSYYPINGSTNLECNIAIGTIVGIWQRKSINDVSSDDCLQSGRDLIAAVYCIYSFSTELIVSFGNGNRRFRLDPILGEFTFCESLFVMPEDCQTIYSANEGNTDGMDPAIKSAIKNRFKKAKPNPYTLRYTGSLIADFHRTVTYGGVYLYPHDVAKPEGKLRVLYECFPLAYIMEQAGGAAITSDNGKGIQNILDIEVTSIHQVTPFIFGCKRDIDIIYEEYRNIASKLGKTLMKPQASPHGSENSFRKNSSNRISSNTITTTDISTIRNESSLV